MGMPCEVNNVLKLSVEQGFPGYTPEPGLRFRAKKNSYRVFPVGVPVMLVDSQWTSDTQVKIIELTWKEESTHLLCEVVSNFDRVISIA